MQTPALGSGRYSFGGRPGLAAVAGHVRLGAARHSAEIDAGCLVSQRARDAAETGQRGRADHLYRREREPIIQHWKHAIIRPQRVG